MTAAILTSDLYVYLPFIADGISRSGATLLYGASLYFFIFLTLGAFIFGNLFGAVVTTNLKMCMAELDETKSGNDNALALVGLSATQFRAICWA